LREAFQLSKKKLRGEALSQKEIMNEEEIFQVCSCHFEIIIVFTYVHGFAKKNTSMHVGRDLQDIVQLAQAS